MTRRRILVSAAVALLAAGTAGAGAATAATAERVRVAESDYLLCAGVETVNVATCVESPTGVIVDLLRGNP